MSLLNSIIREFRHLPLWSSNFLLCLSQVPCYASQPLQDVLYRRHIPSRLPVGEPRRHLPVGIPQPAGVSYPGVVGGRCLVDLSFERCQTLRDVPRAGLDVGLRVVAKPEIVSRCCGGGWGPPAYLTARSGPSHTPNPCRSA